MLSISCVELEWYVCVCVCVRCQWMDVTSCNYMLSCKGLGRQLGLRNVYRVYLVYTTTQFTQSPRRFRWISSISVLYISHHFCCFYWHLCILNRLMASQMAPSKTNQAKYKFVNVMCVMAHHRYTWKIVKKIAQPLRFRLRLSQPDNAANRYNSAYY